MVFIRFDSYLTITWTRYWIKSSLTLKCGHKFCAANERLKCTARGKLHKRVIAIALHNPHSSERKELFWRLPLICMPKSDAIWKEKLNKICIIIFFLVLRWLTGFAVSLPGRNGAATLPSAMRIFEKFSSPRFRFWSGNRLSWYERRWKWSLLCRCN